MSHPIQYPDNTDHNIVVVSGFFDPYAKNHTRLFKSSKHLFPNTYLIVGVNNDEAIIQKKGQAPFMPLEDRIELCESVGWVDEVRTFQNIKCTACALLDDVYTLSKKGLWGDLKPKLWFSNGGDRGPDGDPIPEEAYAKEHGLPFEFLYGVGGKQKIASSSEFLRAWVNNTMEKYGEKFRLVGKY